MSRSYWVSIFAVVGWLTVTLSAAQTPKSQGVPGKTPGVEEQTSKEPAGGQQSTDDRSFPVRIMETPDQAEHSKEREAKSDQHEADDLAAQRKAAEAAWKGAVAAEGQINPAWGQVGIALIGTGLLIYTLWLTRESLGVTRSTAQRQLRAYVLIEGVAASKDPQNPKNFGVIIHTKNFGLTPAHDLLEWADIYFGSFPLTEPLPLHVAKNPGRSILAPSGLSLQIPTYEKLTPLMTNSIIAGHAAVYVYGEIHYTDAFGTRRETKYRFMCLEQGETLGLFRSCEDGNSYT